MQSALLAFLRRVGHLFRKELLAILKDRSNLVILIMPVLMQTDWHRCWKSCILTKV
ncbi:MAG: hypothetical protein FWG56_09135 [Desulfovibrionaceae bacterium]|nr:hypothetical protein [Desulfovibrionaceae bacterium]